MQTKILAFAGKLQSGKNTCSNFLHGCQMKAFNVIHNFHINTDGDLLIEDEKGQVGKLDVTRTDLEFGEWASVNMWPLVKNYAFATELKEIGINLFGIPRECVYGTDEQKAQKIPHLLWQNMPGVTPDLDFIIDANPDFNKGNIIHHHPGPMSAREWMQYFGTEICRKMYDKVWTNRTLTNIKNEEPLLAIISDCRFQNECEAIKEAGGYIIRLRRNEDAGDAHKSENGMGTFSDFDAVLDNRNMTVEETLKELLSILDSWGWGGE